LIRLDWLDFPSSSNAPEEIAHKAAEVDGAAIGSGQSSLFTGLHRKFLESMKIGVMDTFCKRV